MFLCGCGVSSAHLTRPGCRCERTAERGILRADHAAPNVLRGRRQPRERVKCGELTPSARNLEARWEEDKKMNEKHGMKCLQELR